MALHGRQLVCGFVEFVEFVRFVVGYVAGFEVALEVEVGRR